MDRLTLDRIVLEQHPELVKAIKDTLPLLEAFSFLYNAKLEKISIATEDYKNFEPLYVFDIGSYTGEAVLKSVQERGAFLYI
ncbi:hypothetical protein D6777_00380 [Candidatus Woesearchaeota archaeon]|nr:MAG: hypothetical protein D6777_00380 [Candidatus Woesearchaeota archaeon]